MRNADTVKMDLEGKWWTRRDEMVEELESLDYSVIEANDEIITITDDHDECEEYNLYIGHAGCTMWVEEVRKAVTV